MRNLVFWRLKQSLRKFPCFRRALDHHDLKQRFPVEYALYTGAHSTDSTQPSILHFSVNKAATQYVKKLLFELGEENGLTKASMHDLAFNSDFPYLTDFNAENCGNYQKVFKPTGYVYSVFSGSTSWVNDLDRYRIVVMVRDPRDVVTSGYYSAAFSHAIPPELNPEHQAFLEHREKVKAMNINDYVLEKASNTHNAFSSLMSMIQMQGGEKGNPSNILITKYEDMSEDFEAWLDQLIHHCQLTVSADKRSQIVAKANSIKKETASGERQDKHVRKARPGDHREKLRPETIEQLNEEFKDVLEFFNYN